MEVNLLMTTELQYLLKRKKNKYYEFILLPKFLNSLSLKILNSKNDLKISSLQIFKNNCI